MKYRQTLAIIGSGPSCIFLLKHLLDNVCVFRERLDRIEVFEKSGTAGMGMPYNPETTERWNMSNISSEELPPLTVSLADWLRQLDAALLEGFGIAPGEVSETEVYSRLVLGEYLRTQFQAIIAELTAAGILVREHSHCKIVDVQEEQDQITLVPEKGAALRFDRVVLATGHYWPEDDHPASGHYASPWPISKLLPADGQLHNFPIGTLGASLSAFDVVTSLAHRHGTFTKSDSGIRYDPHPGTDEFRIIMHSADGLLPHLQYIQAEPIREIERHVSERQLYGLRDGNGFLRLDTYFDRVCRPVLLEAFRKDGRPDVVRLLNDSAFGLVQFAEKMTAEHEYVNPFDGMHSELQQAEELQARDQPAHWKESIDDLMYTLNFYAELMPAEDHLTLHSKFLPFLMNVIAALPLPSARKLLALHEAGKLEMVTGMVKVAEPSTGDKTTKVVIDDQGDKAESIYRMFVECSGQDSLKLDDFPFQGLRKSQSIREARAAFENKRRASDAPEKVQARVFEENGTKFYVIGGVDIDRSYRLIGTDGTASNRAFDIAFPHASGLRPYSYGLQACHDTTRLLVAGWLAELPPPAHK